MVSTNIARTDDGTIQINFFVPQNEIDKASEQALTELANNITVKGFRKGKAPIEKAKEKIDPGVLLEKSLGKILPEAYTKALIENKIVPIIYPKFEILKQGETWEIQAKVAELPVVTLPDYKALISGAIRAASLKKELAKQEKEEVVIRTLIDSIKVTIPRIIIDEEVNARLSQLLERTEKLGLKLEQYLASIGKDEKTLRSEYEKQVSEGISLELILNKIALEEKTKANEEEVEKTLKTAGIEKSHPEHLEQQRELIRSVLKRRMVLDWLANLS